MSRFWYGNTGGFSVRTESPATRKPLGYSGEADADDRWTGSGPVRVIYSRPRLATQDAPRAFNGNPINRQPVPPPLPSLKCEVCGRPFRPNTAQRKRIARGLRVCCGVQCRGAFIRKGKELRNAE